MKKKSEIIAVFLFIIFSSILLSSCYTKKKGVVPCPSWGQAELHQNQADHQLPASE